MTSYTLLLILTLIAISVKKVLDVNSLTLRVRKNKSIRDEKNPLDRTYQFIKGLY
ncbi:MAG: hypothetical protein J0L67_17365 [Cytophagales bacterium]|nr:hypothetical protein [Cytophagales bacterium]